MERHLLVVDLPSASGARGRRKRVGPPAVAITQGGGSGDAAGHVAPSSWAVKGPRALKGYLGHRVLVKRKVGNGPYFIANLIADLIAYLIARLL